MGNLLEFEWRIFEMKPWTGIINQYSHYLPVDQETKIISMYEGNTPLIKSISLYKRLGENVELYFKYEGLNPTGSFKDRGMTMAVSKAVTEGAEAIICASTGNTSASAAAYAARAGIQCVVLIPAKSIALGKLAQAMIHGAKVIAIDGSFDDALKIVKQIVDQYPYTLVNSINPYRLQGQKSAAFEICDQLGKAPDFHAIPVGNAGNISAYWMGFKDYYQDQKISQLPQMLGFQAAGSAPIVEGHIIDNPQTIATAIKIGNPANWKLAESSLKESLGKIDAVTDEEILYAYQLLTTEEGIFGEPGSLASIAGLLKLAKSGYFDTKKPLTITATITGHGLKDPDRAIECAGKVQTVTPNLGDVLKMIQI